MDETECLTEFQQRLTERDYDLVLVALDPSDPNPLGIVEDVLRLGQRVPMGCQLHPTEDTNRTSIERLLSGATHLGKADEARSETEDTLRTLYRAIEQAADQGPGSARQAGVGSQCGPLIRAS